MTPQVVRLPLVELLAVGGAVSHCMHTCQQRQTRNMQPRVAREEVVGVAEGRGGGRRQSQ